MVANKISESQKLLIRATICYINKDMKSYHRLLEQATKEYIKENKKKRLYATIEEILNSKRKGCIRNESRGI